MSAREAFGPNLRRQRIQRGVSLEQIAEATKVSVSLWAGLERNDFSRWPTGIYARSYVRDYAAAIGADPEATVDEFCRWFPQGDRRAAPSIREHAEIIGHALDWRDETPPTIVEGDRRRSASSPPRVAKPTGALSTFSQVFGRLRRAIDRA
jgi:transcriptional regulator with XRE-family HTH domain